MSLCFINNTRNEQLQAWAPYQDSDQIPYQLQPIMLVSLDQLKLIRIVPQEGTFVLLSQTPIPASPYTTVFETSVQVTPAYLVYPLPLINQDQGVQQAILPGCCAYSSGDIIPNYTTRTDFQEPQQYNQNISMAKETIGNPIRQPKQKKHVRRYGATLEMLMSGYGFPSFYCRGKKN